ncbi:MAG TPA: hypothetical protein VNU97_03735 [Rhizomicrobium sp.]|jgi:hypothetical protein|nr:hypothetical protein [Rhizomicrobium sp.]
MRSVVLSLAMLCALASAHAAAPAGPPKQIDVARKALAAAVAAHDLHAAAALIAFPLAVDMYRAPPAMTKPAFLAKNFGFTALFGGGDKDLLACIANGALAYQGDKTQFGAGAWFADCNGNEYYFASRGGTWLLTAYQNINE